MSLRYEQTTMDDLQDMEALFRRFLNDGDGVEEYLREGLSTPGYIGIKCMDGEKMVAVLSARPGLLFTYPHAELEQRITSRWGGKCIYTGEMVAVLPEYRGHGIAKTMTLQWAQAMRDAGCEYLMLELWDKKDGDVPASGMIKYVGTEEASWIVPDFYRELHLHGMTCPDCAGGICTCGATIVMIKL